MDRSKIVGEFGHRWQRVAIGLGSNIGNTEQHLARAAKNIARHLLLPKISQPVDSEPVDCPPGSNNFLNAVMVGLSRLPPEDLLAAFKAIEKATGRRQALRNAPRAIDCDLLLYGCVTSDRPELALPHPQLDQRWFWLLPLRSLSQNIELSSLAKITEIPAPPTQQLPRWQCWSPQSLEILAEAEIEVVSDLDLDC